MSLQKRKRNLNKSAKTQDGKTILYIMSRDQRAQDNHALLIAAKRANELKVPLVVGFIAYPKVGVRLKNQFHWMYDGLKEVERGLKEKNIAFCIVQDTFKKGMHLFVNHVSPKEIYYDFSPLRGPLLCHKSFADYSDIPVFEVDTHNIVPAWIASDKEEYAARTFRPKIHKHLEEFLQEPENIPKLEYTLNKVPRELKNFEKKGGINWQRLLDSINAEYDEEYNPPFTPGKEAAHETLRVFIHERLQEYSTLRNNPVYNHLSQLSPYLHYGQISSLRAVLEVKKYVHRAVPKIKSTQEVKELQESKDTFIEEIVVRKELSDNFCFYNQQYDSLEGAKDWARKTLQEHKEDQREHIYSYEELENGKTHDPAWNAAQNQMRKVGKIHGYMRMYWAKKILEWTNSPEEALKIAIKLNDKYHLDGYDPSGYVGCLWSIAGVHDRGWTEREVFGKIRYMNFNGLKRKFDIEKYVAEWGRNEL